jgi:streptomycin 6-kinase
VERIDQDSSRIQAARKFLDKQGRGEPGFLMKGARIINPLIAEIIEHHVLYGRLHHARIITGNHDPAGAVTDEFRETVDEHKLRNMIRETS